MASANIYHRARALPQSRWDLPCPAGFGDLAWSRGFWGRCHVPRVLGMLSPFTLLQLPTRQAEQGLREHLRAGTGLSASAQPPSLLQRTGLHTAPRPHVAEHCNTGTGWPGPTELTLLSCISHPHSPDHTVLHPQSWPCCPGPQRPDPTLLDPTDLTPLSCTHRTDTSVLHPQIWPCCPAPHSPDPAVLHPINLTPLSRTPQP